MDIIIQSLGFTASESLDNFTREKLNSLNYDKIIRANVTFFTGPGSNPDNNYCEIRLEVPGNDPFVKRNSPYFETAVTECVDILSESLKRTRSKQAGRRQADPDAIHDAILQMDDQDPDLEDVVK